MTRLTPVDSTNATLELGAIRIELTKGDGARYIAALGDTALAIDALAEAALARCPPLLRGLRLSALQVEVDEDLKVCGWRFGVESVDDSQAVDFQASLAVILADGAPVSVLAVLDATRQLVSTGADGAAKTETFAPKPLTLAALAQGVGKPEAVAMLPALWTEAALHRAAATIQLKDHQVLLEGVGALLAAPAKLSLGYRWSGDAPSLHLTASSSAAPMPMHLWVEKLVPGLDPNLLAALPLRELAFAARKLQFDTRGPSLSLHGQVGVAEEGASLSLEISQAAGRTSIRTAYEALAEGDAITVSAALGALLLGQEESVRQLKALSAGNGSGPLGVILDARVTTLRLELEREATDAGTPRLQAVMTTEVLLRGLTFGVALSVGSGGTDAPSLRITLRGEKDEGVSLPELAGTLGLELGLPADRLPSPRLTAFELSIGTSMPHFGLKSTVIAGFAAGPDSPPPYSLSAALTIARSAEGAFELEASLDASEGKTHLSSVLRDLRVTALEALPLPDLVLTHAGMTLSSGPPRKLSLTLSVALTLGALFDKLLPSVPLPKEIPTEIALNELSLTLTGEDVELSGAVELSSRETVDLGGAAVSLAKLSFSFKRVAGDMSCSVEISGSPGVELVPETLRCEEYSLKIEYSREKDATRSDWSISGDLSSTVFATRKVRLAASYAREQEKQTLSLSGEFSTTEGVFLAIGDLATLDPRQISLGVTDKSGKRSWDFSCSADFTLFSPSDKAVTLLQMKDGKLAASAGGGTTKLSFKAESAVFSPLRWIGVDSDALSLGLEEACFEYKKSGWDCTVRCFAEIDRSARDGLIQALATEETRGTWEALLPGREEKVRVGGALTIGSAGLELGLTNNAAVYVPIPVIVDKALVMRPDDLEARAAICLQSIRLNIGKELSASGKLAVRAPKKLNNIFGEVGGNPTLQFVNSEEDLALSFTLDSKKGASLTVESVPLQLEGSGLLSPEIEGERTWTRFKLGELSFRFGVFPEGDKQLVHVDFADLGAVKFIVPKFSFDGGSFTASGEFEVLRELRIPTHALAKLLRQAQLGKAAELLPPYLQPLDIHILQPNAQGQKVLDPNQFIAELGRIAAVFFGAGAAKSFDPLRPLAQALADSFNSLPQSFVSYLDITVPKHLRFDVALTPATGLGVKIDIEAGQNPIRLLLPPMGVGLLCGVTLRKLSFGELLSGNLFLLAADMDIDLFDLPVLAASVMLPQHISQQFTSTRDIHRRFLIDDLLCLVVYQTGVPIPIPIWFDALGATYHGFEGVQTGVVVNNLAAGLTVGTMLRGAVGLLGEFKRFFAETAYLLPQKLFEDNKLNLGFNAKPCFLELPSYLGGARVGTKLPTEAALLTLSADTLLVPALNFFKTGKLGPFLGAVPAQYRKGSFSAKELQLGPIGVSAEWVLATLGELGGHGAPTELLSVIQGSEDAIVLYAAGAIEVGDSFQGASTRCHLGVLSDPQRGIVTCYALRAELPSLVSLDLGGSLALVLDGRSAALAMSGRLHLTLLNQPIIDAEVALGLQIQGRSGSLVYGAPKPISLFGGLLRMTGSADATVGPQGGLEVQDGALTTLWFDGAVSFLGLRSATRMLLAKQRLTLDMSANVGSIVSADLRCELSAEELVLKSSLRVDLDFTKMITAWIRTLPPEHRMFLEWVLWIPLQLLPVAVDLSDLTILLQQRDGRWRFEASSRLALTVADQQLKMDGVRLETELSGESLSGGVLNALMLELPKYFIQHFWEILWKVFVDATKVINFVLKVLSLPKRETGLGWKYIGGNGVDIGGVDGDGTAWFVSNVPANGGYQIYKCGGGFDSGPFQFALAAGTNIAAGGPPGRRQVWLVNSVNDIYYLHGLGVWRHLPGGKAEDIGVGADASIWITGTDGGVYSWSGDHWQTDGWVSDTRTGNRVAVEPNGCPWVVTGSGAVWRRGTTGQWTKLRDPGSAYDVGVGASGHVFVVSRVGQGSGYTLEFWTGSEWTSFEAQALRVAVTPDGRPVTTTGLSTIQGVWKATLPIPVVELYDQPNYAGKRRSVVIGRYDTAQLVEWGLGNDAVRSIRVPENFRVTLYQNEGFAGAFQAFAADTPEVGAGFGVSSLAVEASVPADRLLAGSSLAPGERLRSRNSAWELVYQPAGNIVLYNNGATIYDSQTFYRGGGRLTLDEGGTLSAVARNGELEWRQGPAQPVFGARLTLYDDGRLELSAANVVYWTLSHGAQRSDALRAGQVLAPGQWLLSPNGAFKLIYQTDGNLVIYRSKDNFVPWHSETDKTVPGRAGLLEDGRLMVGFVQGPGRMLSPAVAGATLTLRDDGELLVSDPEFERWSSSRGALPQPGGVSWRKVPGGGSRIAAGRDGSVWLVGGNPVGNNDYGLWRWNGGSWDPMAGGGVRIAVGPTGQPWVVNRARQVWRGIGPDWSAFEQLPGAGLEIAVGGEGSVWLIGTDSRLYSWDESTRSWLGAGFECVRVAVGASGRPWALNPAGELWRGVGPSWQSFERPAFGGAGSAVAVGADAVWLIGTDGGVWRLRDEQRWESVGAGVDIAVARQAWLVSAEGDLSTG